MRGFFMAARCMRYLYYMQRRAQCRAYYQRRRQRQQQQQHAYTYTQAQQAEWQRYLAQYR